MSAAISQRSVTSVGASERTKTFFKAFLSYSHAADGKLAPSVQLGLHRLARPWYKIRAVRVFRDKTSLSANPSLWGSIEAALSESEFFLLLASPAAAESRWVQQEVAWWLANRGVGKLLILVTEGGLAWDSRTSDFDWSVTDALPRNLSLQFPDEPLWIDLRWAKTEEQLTLRNAQFRSALIDIAAPLHGKAKEDLDGEDIRQHRRTLRLARSAVTGLALLTVGMMIAFFYAVRQKNIAEERRRIAFARELAAAASGRLNTDPELSALLALQAVSVTRSVDQTVSPEAEDVLHQAIQALRARLTIPEHPGRLLGFAFTPAGLLESTTAADNNDAEKSVGDPSKNDVQLWEGASGKRLSTLHGHTNRVNTASFCRNGNRLATASWDRTARIWDVKTGSNLLTLGGHSQGVLGVAFSPDCSRLATAGFDKKSIVWDADKGQPLFTIPFGRTALDGIVFSPDGKFVAVGASGKVAVWNAQRGEQVRIIAAGDVIDTCSSIAFSPDSNRLATSCGTRDAKVWDISTGKELVSLPAGPDAFEEVAFSPDGKRLATASFEHGAELWSMPSGQLSRSLYNQTGSVSHVTFSPDGKLLATADNNKLRLWDIGADQELAALPGSEAVFSPDSKWLATGASRVWDVASRSRLPMSSGLGGSVSALGFTPDSRYFMTISRDATLLHSWDLTTGRASESRSLDRDLPTDLTLELAVLCDTCSAVLSPDGKRLAATGHYGDVTVFDFPSGQNLLNLLGPWNSVAFSPDGKRLAMADFEAGVSVVDTRSGGVLFKLNGHEQKVNGVAFSSDGSILVTGSDDGTARLWSAFSGKTLRTLRGHAKGVLGVAFSPDARRVVTTSWDQTAKVWDTASGAELFTFVGHTGPVFGAAFSGDGRTLATFGQDGIVQLFAMKIEDLMAIARSRVSRNLTPDECRKYLHAESCPPKP